MKTFLTSLLFLSFSFACLPQQGGSARLVQQGTKHSATTLYPTYEGLVMAGYQGWFRAAGDGSAAQRYAYGDTSHSGIDLWPDVSEYEKTYQTPFKTADGKTARFFSSLDQSTTDLHFKWMQQYGVDGVFMQRFFGETRPSTHKKESVTILQHALEAASKYRRAIAVMYDLSGLRGHGEDCSSVIDDWKYLVDSIRVTNQKGEKTYLHHRGRPVVVIWGVGFPDRPYDIRSIGLTRLIDFLKHDPVYGGCAVMLGVPTFWRDLNADCVHDSYLHDLIRQADLIMPWTVQRFSPLLHNDMDRYRDVMLADMQWCERNHVDYVPCVYPGFSWHNLSVHEFPDDVKPVGSIPRQGGRFYWQLLSTAIRSGARMLYVAMFDEVNEGTAIFKASDNPPVGGNVQFIDMDHKPSDTYLWLTGEAARMLRGEKPLSFTMPERK
ncbi:MAG TPA: glycoside hydrolase family 71/99-like protein [Puia sp.]|nr:glycoside hydrolase family 71/99-like protein [Puia sp.]